MNLKKKFLFFFISFFFIYFSLVVFDYILFRIAMSDYIKIRELERENFYNTKKQTFTAKNEGYEPFIYPYLFDKGNIFNKYYKKNKLLPLGGQPNQKVYLCDEGYGLIKFNTDQLGYRNKKNVWVNENYKNSILIVGDSFAAGHCLNYEDTIAAKLNAKTKVTNISAGGNASMMYGVLAKTFIKHIKPKIVLVIFYANDNSLLSNISIDDELNTIFLDNLNSDDYLYYNEENKSLNLNNDVIKLFNNVRKDKVIAEGGGPIGEIKSYSGQKNIIFRGLRYTTLPTFRSILKIFYYKYNFTLPQPSKWAIDSVIDECKQFNCMPIFAYIPSSKYWRPHALHKPFGESLKDYIVNNKNSNFFDLSDYFTASDNSIYYAPKGAHLSALGADIFFKNFSKKYLHK